MSAVTTSGKTLGRPDKFLGDRRREGIGGERGKKQQGEKRIGGGGKRGENRFESGLVLRAQNNKSGETFLS